ncbi:Dps family protein [Phyllobacterium endophyticum]|uniref:Dps family protein n=1 Tax=Phyllobacterium endophyticum TaxID=1149773 RepID=UPI0011C8CAE1|nr:DNA starvation/stationary phase protection protein [Phyllobacterium endophyticum]TXR46986.1 DNA starvation/stationary phase protection protein [Phyllobacterium endophyticum]
MSKSTPISRRLAPINTPSRFPEDARRDIAAALTVLLADQFALYVKTKNFHWHMSGPHFRDYHRLLDQHAAQILDTTDVIAERVRKVGGTTIRSIAHIAAVQRVLDNDADFVDDQDMLAELREDNAMLATRMRETHVVCSQYSDVATTSFLESWIDEAEGRVWVLFETRRRNN